MRLGRSRRAALPARRRRSGRRLDRRGAGGWRMAGDDRPRVFARLGRGRLLAAPLCDAGIAWEPGAPAWAWWRRVGQSSACRARFPWGSSKKCWSLLHDRIPHRRNGRHPCRHASARKTRTATWPLRRRGCGWSPTAWAGTPTASSPPKAWSAAVVHRRDARGNRCRLRRAVPRDRGSPNRHLRIRRDEGRADGLDRRGAVAARRRVRGACGLATAAPTCFATAS